ncbi:TetR/AcrR family transcriptional regulator [Streptomyces sp. NPDC049627]|uniref:TetR/AcrR family transcriptional regulator n=1 Tax=Streptomyces sp. NPDC049627 TaxID=3365595 RepID=UPI0037AF74DA
MPRTVDDQQHERQRRHIAEGLWRLVARAGLEAVSLREVAAESGVSMGRVQHYFASKDEMLLFGLRMAQERMGARIEQRLRDLDAEPRSEDMLKAILDELLGEHPDTRQALLVSVAFYGRGASDPDIAAVLSDGDADIRRLAAAAVREAQDAGRASSALSPEREGDILLTLATGFGVDVALGQRTIDDARATLTYALDRALGHIA